MRRLIRKSYELLGLVAFFTVGEDECRAWTIPVHSRAQEAAGAIHSDLEKHFIRAETIHWDTLLAAGSEAAARSQGTLRLEGKDYRVEDGDVMHIRHSAKFYTSDPDQPKEGYLRRKGRNSRSLHYASADFLLRLEALAASCGFPYLKSHTWTLVRAIAQDIRVRSGRVKQDFVCP